MPKLICFALKEEAAPFRKMAAGMAASARPDMLIVGIGRQNAEQAIRKFLTGADLRFCRRPES
jgi:hypothetical protein